MTELIRFRIPGIIGLSPQKHEDGRGFFSEVFKTDWLEAAAPGLVFCQDNHAASGMAGTLRGLHFQYGGAAQAKLVRCISGAIVDVAVDIRVGSPTFGQHVAVELSADNWRQLFVPHGFAHGYCTLAPQTEVLYKVDRPYDPAREGGLSWRDPALAIDWRLRPDEIVTSLKDAAAPSLSDSETYFSYQNGVGPFDVICHDPPVKG